MKKVFLMASVIVSLFQACKGQDSTLKIGDPAPMFSLRDQNDSLFNLSDYAGKKILVIYFYPKDESSGCTKEACSFRDNYNEFIKAGAMVVGVNSGSADSHRKFAQHYQLPFTLLSDPGNKVLKMFGVKSKFFITGRETFVIDKSGKIAFIFDSFLHATDHEKEALSFIKKQQEKDRS
jgi:thioredoxin-dependent peroxiredoxin